MSVKAQSIALPSSATRNVALVVSASLLVAICAHISVPIPYSPVPFTLQDLAVLLVGLSLGPTRGFAALALYLAEGAAGLPFFTPSGPGGIAQLIGPTGGYLMAYPFVALVTGAIFAKARENKFITALIACFTAEVLLFACGTTWLMIYTHSLAKAVMIAIVPFLPIAAVKIVIASTLATKLKRA